MACTLCLDATSINTSRCFRTCSNIMHYAQIWHIRCAWAFTLGFHVPMPIAIVVRCKFRAEVQNILVHVIIIIWPWRYEILYLHDLIKHCTLHFITSTFKSPPTSTDALYILSLALLNHLPPPLIIWYKSINMTQNQPLKFKVINSHYHIHSLLTGNI